MKAVIFAGGAIGDYNHIKRYLRGADLIICADSGADYALDVQVIPDLVVGDMDSISKNSLDKINKMGILTYSFPVEKDCTDTELALELALNKGASQAVLLGGIGDRPDHSLANISLMISFLNKGLKLKLADEKWEMFLITDEEQIYGKKGDILSLISITPEVTGIETKGLYYPLNKESLFIGVPRGISNVFIEEKAIVKIKKGILLGIKVKI